MEALELLRTTKVGSEVKIGKRTVVVKTAANSTNAVCARCAFDKMKKAMPDIETTEEYRQALYNKHKAMQYTLPGECPYLKACTRPHRPDGQSVFFEAK